MTDDAAEHRIANVFAIRMASVFMISMGTIWLRTRTMPRSFVVFLLGNLRGDAGSRLPDPA